MSVASITRKSVLAAVDECDRSGRGFFRAWHGYGRASAYELEVDGRRYDSKAIIGVAYAYEHRRPPLLPVEFSGGVEHSARQLVRLGFMVRRGGELVTEASIPRRLSLRPRVADLRLYVCRPTNSRSVAACYEHGFGTLLSPITVRSASEQPTGWKVSDLSGHTSPLPGLPYVLDNGVWSCHVAGVEWSDEPLMRMLSRFADDKPGPGFVVLPDIIGAGEESLARSVEWLRANRGDVGDQRWLLAVQDGMTVARVREALLEHRLAGVFVGGTTEWKWATVHEWAALGLELGLRVHVGRVNGQRRAELCRDLGVSSIDGSSVSRFAVNARKMSIPCDGDEQLFAPPGPARPRHAIAERRFQLTLGARS